MTCFAERSALIFSRVLLQFRSTYTMIYLLIQCIG